MTVLEKFMQQAFSRCWMQMAVQFAVHEEKIRGRVADAKAEGDHLVAAYAEGMADYAAGVAALMRDLASGKETPETPPMPSVRPKLKVVRTSDEAEVSGVRSSVSSGARPDSTLPPERTGAP